MFSRSWLICCVVASAAIFATSASAQRKSVSGSEVTGTFKAESVHGYRDELRVQALGGGKIRFSLSAYWVYQFDNEWSSHVGEAAGEAAITGDTAVYGDGECTLKFKFTRPGVVKVTQVGTDANCGFGANVYADGVYRKVSSKKPKFEEF